MPIALSRLVPREPKGYWAFALSAYICGGTATNHRFQELRNTALNNAQRQGILYFSPTKQPKTLLEIPHYHLVRFVIDIEINRNYAILSKMKHAQSSDDAIKDLTGP